MEIGLSHYLSVGAILFTIGVFGIFLNRKNVIVILMSVELMLLAVNINLVAFSSFLGDLTGPDLRAAHPDRRGGGSGDRPCHRRRLLPQSRLHRRRRHQSDERLRAAGMYSAIVFLPLIGALLAGFFGRWLGAKGSGLITSMLLTISAALSWIALYRVGPRRARICAFPSSNGSPRAISRRTGRCASTR